MQCMGSLLCLQKFCTGLLAARLAKCCSLQTGINQQLYTPPEILTKLVTLAISTVILCHAMTFVL